MATTVLSWYNLSLTFVAVHLMVMTCTVHQVLAVKFVDMSHAHGKDSVMATPDMPKYQTQVQFDGELSPGVFAKWYSYSIGEHGGTHMDSPNHFFKGGWSLDEIPLENTIANGIMVDCSEEVARDPLYKVTLQKLLDWEESYGKIPPKSAAVINFNWSHKYTNATAYLNPTDPTDFSTYRFPSVSEEAINFLVDERDINILALDSMSPDLINTDFPVHLKILTNNKVIIENLKDPHLLPPKGFRFHASPVKFIGGTGVQTRVYAMIEDDGGCEACKPGSGTVAGCSALVIALSTLTAFISL